MCGERTVFNDGGAVHLLLTGQALTFHGVLVIDGKLGEELPAALQRSIRPRDGTLTFRDELHELHGLMGNSTGPS